MDRLEVVLAGLAGFELDLADVATGFSSNAGRLLPGVRLPGESGELLSTLAPDVENFHDALSSAHKDDVTAIETLASGLDTARREYLGAEGTSTAEIADGNAEIPGQSDEVTRFSGLHIPHLPQVEEAQATVRNVVNTGIDSIRAFDDPWGQIVGMKPAADYLSPLVGDWEVLRTVGERIGLLSVNDHAASENIVAGNDWLQTIWTRLGAQAFGRNAGSRGAAIAGRGRDLEVVSKIVQNAGACLERAVYNQSVDLSNTLTQPMTFVGFKLPLGVWALLTHKPMQESQRAEIISAVDSLKTRAKSRQDYMTAMLDRVSSALAYSPGRAPPSFDPADFEVPEKVPAGSHAMRYGFRDNVWWEGTAVPGGLLAV
ncbi:hypothetical protein [Nocardia carnea]|uniref:hypothetical protein n=1 Tax=Nocardia carnea TaxID=37328 RepID=UPI002453FEEB|nr:hypothetical protein [Nocardia carnea]